ncbi:UNVERIFIED_CONTAM: hypothetical protein FKN15_060286 [Acipenser sinensis]
MLAELLCERTATPAPCVPLQSQGVVHAEWQQEDLLSFAASEEAVNQEFTSEEGNYNSILVAYQSCLLKPLSQSHRPTPKQLEELRLVNKNLLRISKFNGQAVGRNLAALIAARHQLWLPQARMADGDKAPLLNARITPGHTFGPTVDGMRSHRAQESTKELMRLLTKRLPLVRRPAPNWRPRFQQPQRPAQPAPGKARGGFHNRTTAVQRGNFNKFRCQKSQAKPLTKQQP